MKTATATYNLKGLPAVPNRRLVRDFLLPALNLRFFGQYLEWTDDSQRVFKVLYHHKNANSWTEDTTKVFQAWDMMKDRTGKAEDYHTKARQRFKAALQKCREIKKISPTTEKHVEVYQFKTKEELYKPSKTAKNPCIRQRTSTLVKRPSLRSTDTRVAKCKTTKRRPPNEQVCSVHARTVEMTVVPDQKPEIAQLGWENTLTRFCISDQTVQARPNSTRDYTGPQFKYHVDHKETISTDSYHCVLPPAFTSAEQPVHKPFFDSSNQAFWSSGGASCREPELFVIYNDLEGHDCGWSNLNTNHPPADRRAQEHREKVDSLVEPDSLSDAVMSYITSLENATPISPHYASSTDKYESDQVFLGRDDGPCLRSFTES